LPNALWLPGSVAALSHTKAGLEAKRAAFSDGIVPALGTMNNRRKENPLINTSSLRSRCHWLSLLAAAWVLGSGSVATAQDDDYRISYVRPEVHLSAGGHADLGAGFRVDIAIVPNGFLRNKRDDFALSPGMDIQFFDFRHDAHDKDGPDDDHDPDTVLFIPQLAAQWNVYFPNRAWSIFPELGVAPVIGSWDGRDDVHVDPLAAFGARKHFNRRTALVMRAGWPSGFQIGLSF